MNGISDHNSATAFVVLRFVFSRTAHFEHDERHFCSTHFKVKDSMAAQMRPIFCQHKVDTEEALKSERAKRCFKAVALFEEGTLICASLFPVETRLQRPTYTRTTNTVWTKHALSMFAASLQQTRRGKKKAVPSTTHMDAFP